MAADAPTAPTPTATLPVLRSVLETQRRSLLLWTVAMAAVAAIYTSFYPSMGGGVEWESMIDQMPEGLVEALGYDTIGSAAGYLQSTVFGVLGPVLLLVFAIMHGARLIAGQEEDGTLELELAAPVSRRQVYTERLIALWLDVAVLVAVLTAVTWLLSQALGMDVSVGAVGAGAVGLFLLTLGFATLAIAIGAATGRRGRAVSIAAGLAVLAYMANAIGPAADLDWMETISPFGWYLGGDPLLDGLDIGGLILLAAVPVIAGVAGWWMIDRRDLMV